MISADREQHYKKNPNRDSPLCAFVLRVLFSKKDKSHSKTSLALKSHMWFVAVVASSRLLQSAKCSAKTLETESYWQTHSVNFRLLSPTVRRSAPTMTTVSIGILSVTLLDTKNNNLSLWKKTRLMWLIGWVTQTGPIPEPLVSMNHYMEN